MQNEYPVVVIGAGPAGMTSAWFAATALRKAESAESRPVLLLDHKSAAGLKLLTTGGGRCNLANTLPQKDLIASFAGASGFVRPALSAYPVSALRGWFDELGVPTHATDGFHIFPVSEHAIDVRDRLLEALRAVGVQVRCHCHVNALRLSDDGLFQVGIQEGSRHVRSGDDRCCCDPDHSSGWIVARKVILAAGGQSKPLLGSDGSGFALARQLGHTVVEPVTALTVLKINQTWIHECTGISFEQVRLQAGEIRSAGTGVSEKNEYVKLTESTANLLFTHEGLSGYAAMDVSGVVSRLLLEKKRAWVRLRLFPDRDMNLWRQTFQTWRKEQGKKQVVSLLGQEIPKKLAAAFCEKAAADVTVSELSKPAATALAELLAELTLEVAATGDFADSMLTAGGVERSEINPKTCESRKQAGLFFAGEVCDVDGPCGGYNLHWAFASGRLAGLAAVAESI